MLYPKQPGQPRFADSRQVYPIEADAAAFFIGRANGEIGFRLKGKRPAA